MLKISVAPPYASLLSAPVDTPLGFTALLFRHFTRAALCYDLMGHST